MLQTPSERPHDRTILLPKMAGIHEFLDGLVAKTLSPFFVGSPASLDCGLSHGDDEEIAKIIFCNYE